MSPRTRKDSTVSTPNAALIRQMVGAYAEYDPARFGRIGHMLFPKAGRSLAAGGLAYQYPIVPREAYSLGTTDLTRIRRAPGSSPSTSNFTFQLGTGIMQEYAHEVPVDRLSQTASQGSGLTAEDVAIRRAINAVESAIEKTILDQVTDTTTYTGASLYLDTAVTWATAATAVPISDIETAITALWDRGVRANTIVMSRAAWVSFSSAASVLARFQYNGNVAQNSLIPAEMIASMFGVDQVLVPGMAYDSAKSGQTAVLDAIWPDGNVFICASQAGELDEGPSVGRTFTPESEDEALSAYVYDLANGTGRVAHCKHLCHPVRIDTEAGFLLKVN